MCIPFQYTSSPRYFVKRISGKISLLCKELIAEKLLSCDKIKEVLFGGHLCTIYLDPIQARLFYRLKVKGGGGH